MPPVAPQRFQVDAVFRVEIHRALLKAPSAKASGDDELFAEVLQLTPLRTTEFICELWAKIGRLGYTPESWRTTVLVPIHKKGEIGVAENYRPIALLSHMRKIVETALNRTIMKITRFHPTQCGFRERSSCEQALLRYAVQAKTHKFAAVLDLKGAYGSIPRHRVMEIIAERLPKNLVVMVACFLTTEKIYTIGDSSYTEHIQPGVPEGSPLSPTLFNMVMDTLAVDIVKENQNDAAFPCAMFADDVNLQAMGAPPLQHNMHTCTKWAEVNHMEWAPPKCTILAEEIIHPPLQLAGQPVKTERETEYLGTYITYDGISPAMIEQRSTKATEAVNALAQTGLIKYLNVRQRANMCKLLITSK